ncbi:hypothetical protein ACQKNS_10300 [Peribacillus sp. NPDC094092]|uniref:hypothetical protein n=1 Tax=Peribacillus sp. NPDC094092 TaxID=3390611 RepID=UPI003D00954A
MPQDNTIDPFNNPANNNDDNDTIDRAERIDDGLNPGFQREERPVPNGSTATIEGVANVQERFPSDHERLMSRIDLGDALIKREKG